MPFARRWARALPGRQLGSVPRSDANDKYDVYFMNTTSGESRRVTADSATFIDTVDISRTEARSSTPEIRPRIGDRKSRSSRRWAVPARGLWTKASAPNAARRRANRIPLRKRLWKPVGSGVLDRPTERERPSPRIDRQQSTDTDGFCWSPDGKSICWMKHFSGEHHELVAYALSTKKVRQLTHDNKSIRMCAGRPRIKSSFRPTRPGTSTSG